MTFRVCVIGDVPSRDRPWIHLWEAVNWQVFWASIWWLCMESLSLNLGKIYPTANQRVGKVDDPVALPACFHRHKAEHPSEALSVRQDVHLIDTLRAVASAAIIIFHSLDAEMKDFWRPISLSQTRYIVLSWEERAPDSLLAKLDNCEERLI